MPEPKRITVWHPGGLRRVAMGMIKQIDGCLMISGYPAGLGNHHFCRPYSEKQRNRP